ncbi:hypothetical protein H0H92_013792, partial [Tricholoma furcatifolium]
MAFKKSTQPLPATPGPRKLRDRVPGPEKVAKLTRRTSEQVRADKAQKEKEKQDQIKAREDWINDVAHLEKSMDQEDIQATLAANHPPTSTQEKIARPLSTTTPDARSLSGSVNDSGEEENEDSTFVPTSNDLELANSDDEEYELIKVKKTRRASDKAASGLRAQVLAAHQSQLAEGAEDRAVLEEAMPVNKRKAPIIEHMYSHTSLICSAPSKTKKAKTRNAGLRSGWDSTAVEPLPVNQPIHKRSASTGSAVSNSKAPENDETDEEGTGGISDDAGEFADG